MKFLQLCLVFLLLTNCNQGSKQLQKMDYLETKKGTVVDEYFGEKIADPYRWLEDDRSAATEEWVKAQNKVTQSYLNNITYRSKLSERLQNLWNYEKVSAPFTEGDYTYFYKNTGLQNQSVLYRYPKASTPDLAEIFLDPNIFSEDGTTSLGNLSFSESGEFLAYTISEGGSDWRKIILMNVISKTIVGDTLTDVKFSGISWVKDKGFYYSSYDKPNGSELSDKTDQHKLYYHQLGTKQSADLLVFGGDSSSKYRYVGASVSRDNRYLYISAANSTSGNKLFIKDLNLKNSAIMPIVDHELGDVYVLDNLGTTLYIVTNLAAPNRRLVTVDAATPGPENWTDFIAESSQVLNPSISGKYILVEYMVDAVSKVFQYDYSGNLIRELVLPGIGNAGGFGSKKDAKIDYYNFSNYYTPSSTYVYDLETGVSELYSTPSIDFDPSNYESHQVFYNSKDGTKIPMIITHKKGIKLSGQNPTILYGYGGFDISLYPSFSVVNALWMELGGVYAVPNLRGGGEYGKKWHDAGVQMNKQNVFDDFIAAAEFLISKNYCTTDYLAIMGRSNGGLLVGATMTQRPDLMKVALPGVGVLDMLRYHTFTSGAGWAYDYGTSQDSKEMFTYLKGYSPVHNVKQGVHYPATLITTGDHDDRVVPAHSFKFAAELQDKQEGLLPTLIRIETDAGHGAGTPISKRIDQFADIYGFTLYNMGFKKLP